LLTADLVMARRRGGKLLVPPLGEGQRAEALALAGAYLRIAAAHIGRSRESLLETCRMIPVGSRGRKLAQGLLKLALDRCDFREESALDPPAVRRALFERAAEARRQGAPVASLRTEVLGEVAARFQASPEALEQALYADLPAAHVLEAAPAIDAAALVAGYEMAQWQAVLLRAVRVRARVHCASPEALRALFRKLKFLGLIHRTTAVAGTVAGGRGRVEHEITLDGPFSLFESVTRYGLALGLALPALAACDAWSIEAELRWGAARQPLSFSLAGGRTPLPDDGAAGREQAQPRLRDDVQQLLERLRERDRAKDGPWQADVSQDVLELPGLGVCVPDLVLRHRSTGKRVLVEVLGYWSREAVWKRLDLARAGLPTPIIFVASRHLRVSEELLDDVDHAALYVYARVMSPDALLARAAALTNC
jgi:predicted nuclease of restriction endonuclease-like RecB superfamily